MEIGNHFKEARSIFSVAYIKLCAYALHSPTYKMLYFGLMERGIVNLAISFPVSLSGYIASKNWVSNYRLLSQSIEKCAT